MGRVYLEDDGRGIWMMRRMDILGSQLNSRIYIQAERLSSAVQQRKGYSCDTRMGWTSSPTLSEETQPSALL